MAQHPAAAVSNDINPYSAVAVADMAGKKDRFVKFFQATPAGSQDRLAFNVCGVTDEPDGLLDDQPRLGDAGCINTIGRLRIELGETLAAFAECGPDSLGRAVAYGAGHGYVKLLKGGAVGEVVDCVWLGRRKQTNKTEANDADDVLGRDSFLHKITISAGADVATLPDGRYDGQRKRLQVTVDGGGTYAVTGKFLTRVTATVLATFNDVDDLLDIVWSALDTKWFVLLNTSVVLS